MRLVTIRDAKARLNELVTLAEKGEDIVILRGSKVVACLKPADEQAYEAAPLLTDAQADRLDRRIAQDYRAGRVVSFPSPEHAVRSLRRRFRKRIPA